MDAARFPDFYIIGAPKCGTTAACKYLSEHSSVFFPNIKEPHFFSADFPRYNVVTDKDEYLSLFSEAEKSQTIGEGSVWYLYSEVAVSEILKVKPDARFVVFIRKPVDAVEALHAEQLLALTEDMQDLEKAWAARKDRASGKSIPLYCHEPAHLQYEKVYSYAPQLKRLLAQVSSAQVKIVVYEEFFQSPETAYADLQAFLGLPIEPRTSFGRINASRAPRRLFLHRLMSRPPRLLRPLFLMLAGLSRRYGLRLGLLAMKLMRVEKVERKRSRPEFRDELSNAFKADIVEVEAILGRSIEAWKPVGHDVD